MLGSGSSTNTSTARSGSMWLSLMKPITLRPVRSSISRTLAPPSTPSATRTTRALLAGSPGPNEKGRLPRQKPNKTPTSSALTLSECLQPSVTRGMDQRTLPTTLSWPPMSAPLASQKSTITERLARRLQRPGRCRIVRVGENVAYGALRSDRSGLRRGSAARSSTGRCDLEGAGRREDGRQCWCGRGFVRGD